MNNLGDVDCGELTGNAYILSSIIDHPSGCTLSKIGGRTAKANQGGAVKLADYGTVGKISGLHYSARDGRMLLYFILDPSEAHKLYSAEELYATPTLNVERLGCLTCGRSFSRGDAACRCLKKSPRVILHDFSITGLALTEKVQYHSITEMRARATAATTASVLSNLIL